MVSFPDATTLSAALMSMERQPLAEGVQAVFAGLGVISCLVQALRKTEDIAALCDAMNFLGKVSCRYANIILNLRRYHASFTSMLRQCYGETALIPF